MPKRAISWDDDKGEPHGIDFLGVGCHTLVAGPHKSGAVHEWPLGDIVDWESDPGLPLVNAGTFGEVHGAVRDWIDAKGYQSLCVSLCPQGKLCAARCPSGTELFRQYKY